MGSLPWLKRYLSTTTVPQPVGSSTMAPHPDNIESESSTDKSVEPVMVNTLEAEDLGHTPRTGFRAKRFIRSLGSKDAWFGDYVSSLRFHGRLAH
jgi:hypothetical protein